MKLLKRLAATVVISASLIPVYGNAAGVTYEAVKTGDRPGIYEVKGDQKTYVAALPSQYEEVMGGVLAFGSDGLHLYHEGIKSEEVFAPANPDAWELSAKKDSVALVYAWDHEKSQDPINGDLYYSDLSGHAERVFSRPLKFLPTTAGMWVLYSVGYEIKTAFISAGGSEADLKLCHSGELKDFRDNVLTVNFTEYGATVSNRAKQDTFDNECVKRFGQKVMLDASGDDIRILEKYGEDWTAQARAGTLPEIYGKSADERADRLIAYMKQQTKRSTILIGSPGVGKTATVMHLANRIARKQVPEWLQDWIVFSIRLSTLNSEGLAGVAEQKASEIVKAAAGKKVILLFDEIHQMVGLGTAEGKSHDITEVFKTDLASGNIVIIGTTTPDGNELASLREKAAFFDRFWPMKVEEPETEALEKIFRSMADSLEKTHRVKISQEVINEMIRLSNKYMPSSHHPRKGKNILESLAGKFETQIPLEPKEVTIDALCQEIGAVAGVPVACDGGTSAGGIEDKVANFYKWMNNKVVGQQASKDALYDALASQAVGLNNPDRPAGVFLFLGPSGVGKSFTAKKFSEYVFGGGMYAEFSMGNFQQDHMVAGLIGSPQGYVGSDKPGALYAWVQKAPASVILFDEIDKANRRIYDALLPVLENGYIQDANTSRPSLDFKSGYVIMTSNFGMDLIAANDDLPETAPMCNTDHLGAYKANPELFKTAKCRLDEKDLKDLVLNILLRDGKFGTYFAGRIGLKNMVIFHYLTDEEVTTVARFQVRDMAERFNDTGLELKVADEVLHWAVKTGYDKQLGARGVRDKIENEMQPMVAKKLLQSRILKQKAKRFAVVIKDGQVEVVSESDPGWREAAKKAGFKL